MQVRSAHTQLFLHSNTAKKLPPQHVGGLGVAEWQRASHTRRPFSRHPQLAVISQVDGASPQKDQAQPAALLKVAEARAIAASRGFDLAVRELGPFYRITCRDGDGEGPVVAVSSGFTAAPFGLMHCDSLQVNTKRLSDRGGKSARERGVGLGLLMCGAVIALGAERGCRKAEILAINDDDTTHARLVKYYKRMGFQVVREVGGNGLSDLPHQLVWGGVGTRMDADVTGFLRRWSSPIRHRQ